MDEGEDDARYPANSYGLNQGYGLSHRQKLSTQNSPHQHVGNQYVEDDGGEDEEEDIDGVEDDEDNEESGVQRIGNDVYDDDEEDDDDDFGDPERRQKKRKMKSLLSSYEFAPRVPAQPLASAVTASKPSFGGRNPLTDWNEDETFVLLDAWGDRFLQRGRKSLRSEEWQEVAETVSQVSKVERTDTQCRNRLDTLKKKYKKEKMKFSEAGSSMSKWVYFKKIDALLSSPPQEAGLSCGLDSGEYIFMNPRVYLDSANGFDEMRDSPGNSGSAEGKDDNLDGLPVPPKKTKISGNRGQLTSFKLLADSIQKFGDIYEKTENSKRKQILELERMRMDFHRELEMQKRQILERAQAEIARIHQAGDEANDASADNASR